MFKQKNIFYLFAISIIFCLAISCKTNTTATYNRRNPYPNIEILRYPNSQAYLFSNEDSDKLIIVLEGSGWDSVLGVKQSKNRWKEAGIAVQFLQELGNEYTFLVPEKLKRQPGLVYFNDMEDRANYTAENLLSCYIDSINSYLSERRFTSIVLIGVSEGGILLPLIYERMNERDIVTAMVSMSCGGLSAYEYYELLNIRPGFSQEWYDFFRIILTDFNPRNNEFRDSFEEDYFKITYRWFNSFKNIKPFDYYKNITIPVLFTHGTHDVNVPVESTVYIQNNLPEKPFEYRYFQWGHNPNNDEEMFMERRTVAEWIREHS